MRATKVAAGWVVLAATAVIASGCAVPEASDDSDLLEPLHGPISPAVLTQRPVAAVIPPPQPVSSSAPWRVASVLDGRTLEIFQGLDRAIATLGGIVVPTGDECLAQRATDSLEFVTGGARAFEVIPATPRDGRIDGATVLDEDGENLAVVMLSLGLARVSADAAADQAAIYREVEETARQSAQGIWSAECEG